MKLQEFVCDKAIIADLQATDRNAAISELIDALVAAGATTEALREDLTRQIIQREKHGSTGFGKGVAVPHVASKEIKKMVAAVGVSQKGVDFNALDKAPVFTIFLLLSPSDKPNDHLHAMETIFSNLQKDQFRRFLRQASTVEDIRDLLAEADAQQLHG